MLTSDGEASDQWERWDRVVYERRRDEGEREGENPAAGGAGPESRPPLPRAPPLALVRVSVRVSAPHVRRGRGGGGVSSHGFGGRGRAGRGPQAALREESPEESPEGALPRPHPAPRAGASRARLHLSERVRPVSDTGLLTRSLHRSQLKGRAAFNPFPV